MAFCLITINNLESIWKVWNCNSNNCILLCCFIVLFFFFNILPGIFSKNICSLYLLSPCTIQWLLTNISQMHINLFFLTNKILQLQIQYCSSTKRKRITIILVAVVIIILRNDAAVRLIRILIFFHAKWKVYLALD